MACSAAGGHRHNVARTQKAGQSVLPRTDTIIQLVYTAAVDPQVWPAAVRAMSNAFDATAAGLYVGNFSAREVRLVSLLGIESTYVKSYVDRFLCDNPWNVDAMQEPGYVRTDTSLDRHHRTPGYYRRTPLFNEWMRPQDFIYTLGSNLSSSAREQTKVFLYRPESAGPYTPRDVVRFRRLTRHLMHAMRVAERFAAARYAADSARHLVDRLRFGIVLLDDCGAVLEANAFAAELFARRDGLTVVRDRLVAMSRRSGGVLADVIRAAAVLRHGHDEDTPPAPVRLERADGREPLSALALPLPAHSDLFGVRHAAVALLITDPQAEVRAPVERLQQRYALTRSEARLAAGLMQGLSLRAAADKAGLTYETARWYLKSTFQKTGASRQADLIRLLLCDPQLLLP